MNLFRDTAKEVAGAVGPIIVTVLVLHLTVTPLGDLFGPFLAGATFVYLGLVFFLVGARLGVLPLGERIGAELPQKGSIFIILIFLFVLATVATLADPDVQVLALLVDQAGDGVIPRTLVLWTVSLGVGIFALIAMVRVFFKIPLGLMLGIGFGLAFILSAFVPAQFVPISFDAGGVTTGPLTVPFIMALSVGVASVLGGTNRLAASFGIVALTLIGPILGVLILGLIFG